MVPEGTGVFVGDRDKGEGPDINDKSQGRFNQIIDDFEDQDMKEYNYSSGSRDNTSFNSDDKISGDVSLEIVDPDGNSGTKVFSTSGLENYPSAGDDFISHVNFKTSTNYIFGFWFGQQSDSNIDNTYVIFVNRNGNFEIGSYVGGSFTILASTSISISSDTWLKIVVDWGANGDISADLIKFDDDSVVASVSATDSNFTSGGVGLSNGSTGSGDTLLIDDARII